MPTRCAPLPGGSSAIWRTTSSQGIAKSVASHDQAANPRREQGPRDAAREDFGGSDNEEEFLDRNIPATQDGPSEILGDSRFRHALVAAIEELPERERFVMGMYYEQDMNLKEIGAVLSVTESRVSQLHSQAVARLRTKMRNWTH